MGALKLAFLGAAGVLFIGKPAASEITALNGDPAPIIKEAKTNSTALSAPESAPVTADESTMEWVVMENNDARVVRARLDLSRRTVLSVGSRLSLFPVQAEELPKLSAVMHDERHRCGGYFAYSSKEEAMADLIEPAPAPAARVYALDRPAQVREMMARVSEPRLRAVIEKLSGFHNRYFNTETGVASSGWIKEEWSAIAKDRKDISVSAYAHTWPQPSIIATIKGSKEPETVIVLGGHADSIGSMWGGADRPAPGADDNASGIAVLTEALRTIVESGYRPERTVKFIAYAAEEVGLRGSKDIASAFKAQGVDVAGVVQFDMTSFAGSGNMIYLISDFTSAPQNKYLGRLIDEYVGIPWGETKCGYGCSDHASWTRSGFSASFPFEATKAGANGNIHSVRDTLASAGGNADHSTNFAKLAVAYVVETAKAGKAHLAASRRAQKAAH